MKHRDLLMNSVLGGCIFFALFILISLVFQKLPPFDSSRSFADILIEALVVAIVFSLVMYFYSKRRLKNRKEHKN
jgi:membrane protein DedA with SNARE-associated domain